MVKGITRRVILVKAPDPKLFEQAIFILREDASGAGGVTADQVLQEAQRAADGYVRRNSRLGKQLERVPSGVLLMAGALLASAIWAFLLYYPL